ncbi:hypothetical protein GCM10010495_07600 [Kitasatospora herbaricolor]|uniref:hypothetical protein n=1 Tax=Kitasatospora herbaricolor TaxID=68217 RepID=UPI001748E88F|nr:hypothetical protein [Kitasatospora herbaricolor]MDQ0309802.1 hypothetical protein [Kitasatospora herbaricolor]GGU99497.1 hypothetical protein GCM10010495_07600 [Kitasatospora herbaricolor]
MSTEPVEPSPDDAPPPTAVPPGDRPDAAAPAEAAAPVVPAPPVAVSPWAAPGSPAAAPYAHPDTAEEPAASFDGGPVGGPPAFDVLVAGEDGTGVPARERRPRPVLLLTSALVLGLLLGGGVGYAIQAGRPPTPLPPLQVALPGYPAAVLDAAAAAEAAPKPLAIDGDLRKLVLERPGGTDAWGDNPDVPSWITVGELAERTGNAKRTFADFNRDGFRRAAGVDWKQGETRYRVTLLQYGPDDADRALAEARGMHGAAATKFADGVNGGYQVESEPENWAESTEKYYYGSAVARRGTVVMEIEVFAPQPVDAAALKDLAKKQWERLA